MKVRVTDDANGDLRQIKAFIADRNASAAKDVIERVRVVLARLSLLPKLGHVGVVQGTYEISVPHLPFLIVYRIDVADTGAELVVLRVYHAARDRSTR